jgi:hypothetical protein
MIGRDDWLNANRDKRLQRVFALNFTRLLSYFSPSAPTETGRTR